jgi:hypothetical protein
MKNSEKQLIKALVDELRKSTKTEWNTGDLDKWSTWAKKMRDTINTSVNILSTMANDDNNDVEPENSQLNLEIDTKYITQKFNKIVDEMTKEEFLEWFDRRLELKIKLSDVK